MTSISEAQAEEMAGWMRALADPTRIRILNMLARREDAVCVCEFVDEFPLGQSTISHHLKILRDARFVFAERRGTFMYYQINHTELDALPGAVRHILNAGI
ncbi:MAG TPA: metalloregulator ArsR/SmtB family transcription factor [Thermomicrobiales bacterium]|nr:metalloregulator ArsR/SmtB family transcription factor [Thermomicrobiales bacterium]